MYDPYTLAISETVPSCWVEAELVKNKGPASDKGIRTTGTSPAVMVGFSLSPFLIAKR